MEDMQPYHELKRLRLSRYKVEKLPSWARGDNLVTSLPNLVEIQLWKCNALKCLGPLGKLSYLRSLKLKGLRKLEYIEEKREGFGIGAEDDVEEESLSFPSLEVLKLWKLPRLKGWWREKEEGVADNDEKDEDADEEDEDKEDDIDVYDDEEDGEDEDEDNSNNNGNDRRREPQVSPLFPYLYTLEIIKCPKLTLIFEVPKVEKVKLKDVNEKLRVRGAEPDSEWEEEGEEGPPYYGSRSSSKYEYPSPNSSDSSGNFSTFREVQTDSLGCITSLPCITELAIDYDKKVERLAQVREIWQSCSSSLQILEISNCKKLKSIVKGGLEHLTALETLEIACCPNVTLNPNDEEGDGDGDGDGIGSDPSLPFLPTLHSLDLIYVPNVVNLPKWMQHLTSLHFLSIDDCSALKSLPEWMPHLTSLSHLQITRCSEELERRCCKSPPGQDWPNIQHIPHIEIRKAEW